jgi:hypothetical protein
MHADPVMSFGHGREQGNVLGQVSERFWPTVVVGLGLPEGHDEEEPGISLRLLLDEHFCRLYDCGQFFTRLEPHLLGRCSRNGGDNLDVAHCYDHLSHDATELD